MRRRQTVTAQLSSAGLLPWRASPSSLGGVPAPVRADVGFPGFPHCTWARASVRGTGCVTRGHAAVRLTAACLFSLQFGFQRELGEELREPPRRLCNILYNRNTFYTNLLFYF